MLQAPLILGKPRFPDAALQALARDQGCLAAWRSVLRGPSPLDTLARIEGDFAIALPLDDGRVLLAVDRFARQTLCYRFADGQLSWSPRADQLGGEVDPQALFDYLYFHMIPSPRTVYRGVLRLPPGHCALLDGGQLRLQRYWEPRFAPEPRADLSARKQEFLRLAGEAVEQELGDADPACFLSGGTDSSTVAGLLAGLQRGPVQAYSIGFDAQGYDEMAYARLAAERFGVQHHAYYVTPGDLLANIPRVAAHFDQPFGNSSVLPAYVCAQRAHDDGVRKLLAGDGGDELFGGNARYAKQQLFARYQRVPALARAVLEPLLDSPLGSSFALARKGRSYVEQAKLPMPDRLRLYNLVMRLDPQAVLSPELLAAVDLQAPLALQREVWRATPEPCSELNRELAYDWRFTLAESDLPKVIGATGLAGVATGFPLLSDGLLALSLRLPDDWKLRDQQLRWFFKEALRGFLPDEIIEKKKHGFGLPFGVWAREHAGLQQLAQDSLFGLVERRLVREDFVRQLLGQRLAEHPGYYGEMVWILMMLEQWLRAKAPGFRL